MNAASNSTWTSLDGGDPSAATGNGFGYSYYLAGLALVQGLEAAGGDIDTDALRGALADLTLEAPYGNVELDENRQAVIDVAVSQLFVNDSGELDARTVSIVPGVDQSFGGTFTTDTPDPGRNDPSCEERELPWFGNSIPVVDGVIQE